MKDQLTVNTIRVLSADSVQKANSGHPGLPMGAAPAVYALWAKHMKHNPKNTDWVDRDRFVLSGGHGSALLYSLMHLFGYGLTVDDLKEFRQLGSLTPGHPEYKHTKGVEITTGPLGQGFANAVGFALAENYLANKFNRPGYDIVNHYAYALCGDGCMMEGISSEAASFAGTLGLGKIIVLYDSNNITIEGDTNTTFRENVMKRFEAYGWHVQKIEDGNDIEAISEAIANAKLIADKPSLIEIKTIIGYGAPNKQGKASSHGEPLGVEELGLTKISLGFDPDKHFFIPEEVKAHVDEIKLALARKETEWTEKFEDYRKKYPELAKEWDSWFSGDIDEDLLENEDFWSYEGNLATRSYSEQVLNKLIKIVPNLIGGSADLAPSTKTIMKGRGDYSGDNPAGANLHFGIREHAMTAIANAVAAHGGLRIFISGFFVFSDYMKPSMRMSALMGLPVINVFTHDSIGVGEDGPTHQPVEQLAALRGIPNFTVIRPCNATETAAAWYLALKRINSPTALILTRQELTMINETGKGALKGAYIMRDSEGLPDIILMATGSEVELIYKAYDVLKEKGVSARVVSMPSWEIFEEQSQDYKDSVLPKNVRARLAVEAASSFGWDKYTGFDGKIIAVNNFGASAPYKTLFKEYGFTVDKVVEKALEILNK